MRSARRMIFPVAVSGSSATNSTMRGYSYAARRERTCSCSSAARAGDPAWPGLSYRTHHPLRFGDRLYVSCCEGDFALVDIGDMRDPRTVRVATARSRLMIGVSVGPGTTQFTAICRFASSRAAVFERPSTAALLAA